MAPYVEPGITDGNITHIQVNAWREGAIAAYMLEDAISSEENRAASGVSDAWVQTYGLLQATQPQTLQPYIPERLLLWIQPETLRYDDPIEWSLESVSLATLYESGTDYGWLGNQVVLEGDQSATVYNLIEENRTVLFAEGDLYYSVIARPLFPYELPTGSMAIPEFENEPTQPLTCS